MARVLVVDDEARYRDHISRTLSRDGHEVTTAATGREAIACGSVFRPDVLVADWMLKDNVHGLRVCEALRAMVPEMKTILITGFPSADLRHDANSLQVTDFIQKPFDLARLRDSVRAAGACHPAPLEHSPIAVLDVRGTGNVWFANMRARQLLAPLGRTDRQLNLLALFGWSSVEQLAASATHWQGVAPKSHPEMRWLMRCREHDQGEGWLVVLIPEDQRHLQDHPVVRMLLNLGVVSVAGWPFPGRTLIVDDDQWVRHAVAMQIESGGGTCHTADTVETALQTCERDPGIDVVVLDYELPGDDVGELIRKLRSLLPEARLAGTSGSDRSAEFAALGVPYFLLKPWTVVDLVNALLDRIGRCVWCGLTLPLRRPGPDDTATSWICAGCGCRYAAVFDDHCPEDVLRNVRQGTLE